MPGPPLIREKALIRGIESLVSRKLADVSHGICEKRRIDANGPGRGSMIGGVLSAPCVRNAPLQSVAECSLLPPLLFPGNPSGL